MKEEILLPPVRSWRDIPQDVKRRAMSREGRLRLKMRLVRAAAAAGALALVGWGCWQVTATMRSGAGISSVHALGVPVSSLVLATDGVLDHAWLERTLALPKSATLMSLDLGQLRTRLMATGQVRSASLARLFPSTLHVALSERSPVARITPSGGLPDVPQAPDAGADTLLVARDGTPYVGFGYAPSLVASLPWLTGVALVRQGTGYAPIPRMDAVADLLARAQLDDPAIYRSWQSLSLARLQSDDEIDVFSRSGLKVTFGASEDPYRQIAKLDLLLDAAVAKPDQVVKEINLALGEQVSVAVGPAAATAPAAAAASPSTDTSQAAQPQVLQFKIN